MYKMMATEESVTTGAEEEYQEKMSPTKEDSVLKETPQNFSEVTPNQFGISVNSFIPSSSSSSSKYKDKSCLAKIKARRRSNVGARGSPETNSLIRFIAQQRMKKTPPNLKTPEIVRSSPFFPRVASTLRQKMASFQRVMDVVESDACDPEPAQDSNTGGCIMTRDYLSDGIGCSVGKENNPRATPSRKRRLGLLEGCSVEIREAETFIPHFSLTEQEEAVCGHQSPHQPPSCDPAAASPSQPSLLQEIKPAGTDDSTGTSVAKKRKQVHFGAPLSPEFFDKKMPPSTPLRKGGTPVRALTPGGCLLLRSVLKTPQRSESNSPQHEPELDNPSEFGASPTFVMPHKRRLSEGKDGEDGKIHFPSLEESDSEVCDTECVLYTPLLNLDMAFHEEASSEDLTDCETKPSQSSQVDECRFVPEEKTPEAVSSKRRKKTPQKPEACSSSRERELSEEEVPVRRSVRSAAKSACMKMKMSSLAACLWKKDVDRSLYGSRKYASKKPTLSPIKEKLFLSSQSPALPQSTENCTASNQEPLSSAEIANDTRAQEDLAVTETIKSTLPDSVTFPGSGRGKSLPPRSTVRRRGKKGKGAASDCEQPRIQEVENSEHVPEDPPSSSVRFSEGTPSEPCGFHVESVDSEEPGAQVSPDSPRSDDTGTPEHHAGLRAPSPCCPPSAEDSSNTQSQPAKQGRRKCAEKRQSVSDVAEAGMTERAEGQHGPSQDGQGGGNEILYSWQADFNLEDVFKPIARRGQRSVRRSLRNQRRSDNGSSGLVWLPYTPSDSVGQTGRATRRRLSGIVPVQPPLSEDMQELMVEGDNQ
ncbi:cell division cycle-associated protein 2 isoform X1 [Nothobranchius furzeri]|uniref:Cell division cycle associated 2 n=1 Tax=Nothobranchius furzeri TaxID=105023 RepID=A0A1A8AR91_NOTFU|nr:transcript variant X1 [Nothobranchius furzeri]